MDGGGGHWAVSPNWTHALRRTSSEEGSLWQSKHVTPAPPEDVLPPLLHLATRKGQGGGTRACMYTLGT